MSCSSPIAAYKLAKRSENGKNVISFKPRGLVIEGLTPLSLPCGKCLACRLKRSHVWAIRCVHESKMYSDNCFLTLTYDNDHLPSNGTLIVRDLQLFLKRLHNRLLRERGYGIRYFACGEYGDLNLRPHYHVLLFGFRPTDCRKYSENGGNVIYSSRSLDELWSFGAVRIGDVNYKSAAYVARYSLKKVDGAKRDAGHYAVFDGDGVITERLPEFALMSRRPGIGTAYYEKYGGEIRRHDNIIIDNKPVPSIRYYDLKFEALDGVQFSAVKRSRGPQSVSEARERIGEAIRLRRINDKLLKASLKMKARNL